MFTRERLIIIGIITVCSPLATTAVADWPQYLRDSQHTGDAAGERLTMPLGLVAQVPLEDAILTSPAVVGGRVFVVDQMARCYCIDAADGRIVWKVAPDGDEALGGNTSSPCVVGGKVFYGTSSGNLHILNANSGRIERTIALGQPVLDAVTAANGAIYLQTMDAVVYSFDLTGKQRWTWDHYNVLGDKPADGETDHYGGVAVSVADDRVIMAIGYDLVCVQDRMTRAEHVWTRQQIISDTYLPLGISVCNGYVYSSFPGKDGHGVVLRVALRDGAFDEERDQLTEQWAAVAAPAVRGSTAFFTRQAFGVSAYRFSPNQALLFSSFGDDAERLTPSISSPALSQNHCVFTTLHGELIAVNVSARGRGLTALSDELFRFETPHGKPISSAPAIDAGRVYFGCDDGHLYILGKGNHITPRKKPSTLHRRHGTVQPAGARRYAWPSAFGGSRNANYVDDEGLKPPFRLRWAARSGGLFKQPVCSTENDVIYVTLGGLVVCREQQNGRIRWRRKLSKQAWCRSALLCADGKVFVPRMFSLRYPKVQGQESVLYCLDGETGEIVWENQIGIGDRLRASPVYADGVVAFGSLYHPQHPPAVGHPELAIGQAIDAWDAETGRHLWQIDFRSQGTFLNGPAGCSGDGIMFFAGGGENRGGTGETMAVAPRTGEILWRTSQAYASQTGTPSYQDGRVYLPGTYKLPVACLSASDGSLLWQHDAGTRNWHVDTTSLGPDYFTINNKYEGGAKRWNLADGTLAGSPEERIQLWGPAHGCGSVVLTSQGMALSATIGGLFMTDTLTGKVVWKSPAFASYTCPHAIVSNGRIFYCPQTNGVMYCFEPTTTP